MPRRFEVVAAPVEQRLQEGIQDQAFVAFGAVKGMFETIDGKRSGVANTTRELLNNQEFVAVVVGSGAKLAMPSSLPGFLFVLGLALRLFHWTSVRFASSRAVAKHKSIVLEGGGKEE